MRGDVYTVNGVPQYQFHKEVIAPVKDIRVKLAHWWQIGTNRNVVEACGQEACLVCGTKVNLAKIGYRILDSLEHKNG